MKGQYLQKVVYTNFADGAEKISIKSVIKHAKLVK